MKTKNLLIAGVVALALLLGTGAGTASAQTPGGSDSQAASDASTQLFQLATSALTEAGNSGDLTEYAFAYDVYVMSYLCMAVVSGYNDQTFFLSEFLSGAADTFADAETGFELALAVSALSVNLQNSGNSLGSTIAFLAEQIQSDLQSAINNND